MSAGRESFIARWARLKRNGGEAAQPVISGADPTMPLPDPETLRFDDDFRAFLRQEVEEGVKRVALKKLFHSPQFNVMDGLDIYIDDYTIPSPIDEATIRGLSQARDLLFAEEQADAPVVAVTADDVSPKESAEASELPSMPPSAEAANA